jgi:hypothetical protein
MFARYRIASSMRAPDNSEVMLLLCGDVDALAVHPMRSEGGFRGRGVAAAALTLARRAAGTNVLKSSC